jgi:CHAT domain-containing protein
MRSPQTRRWPRLVIVLLVATALPSGILVYSKLRSRQPAALMPGRSYERALRRGESHSYRLHLSANEYARLEVEQFEIDLRLRILGPDLQPVTETDATAYGRDVASVIARTSGPYEVAVIANENSTKRGHYVLRLVETRAARPADAREVEGQRLLFEATNRRAVSKEDVGKARAQAEKAAALLHESPDRISEAHAQMRLATLCGRASRLDDAHRAYVTAVRLYRDTGEVGGRLGAERALARLLGHFRVKSEDVPTNEDLLRTWKQLGDRRGIAESVSAIAGELQRAGRYHESLKVEREGLELRRKIGDSEGEIRSLEGIVVCETALRQFDPAINTAEEILKRRQATHNERGEAAAFARLGFLMDAASRSSDAAGYYRKAAALHHEQGDTSAEVADRRNLAAALVLALRQASHIGSRSRHLQDAVAELRVARELADGVEKDISSPAWRAGYDADTELAASLIELLEEAQAQDPAKEYAWEAFLTADQTYASYVVASSAETSASLEALQSHLDAETILLEYWLDQERGWLWCVTRDGRSVHHLESHTEIDALAWKAYNALVARAEVRKHEVAEIRDKLAAADSIATAAVAELSRKLLGPVARELHRRRILIVGNGAIQRVPMALFPDPSLSQPTPLIARHEVIYLPSATVRFGSRRQDTRQVPRFITILADPITPNKDVSEDVERAVRAAGESGPLPRLRYAWQEAQGIQRQAPPDSTRILTGRAATRRAVLGGALADSNIVHFATHGLANPQNAELSGLLLTPEPDRGEDGFLRLRDVQNLRLNAELVVLSACRTARGAEHPGAGVISLTSGFLRAGASQVLSTAWKVDDEATAYFMGLFYENLLSKRLSAAEALRQAQMTMAATERWRAPYYWAAFQLFGGRP